MQPLCSARLNVVCLLGPSRTSVTAAGSTCLHTNPEEEEVHFHDDDDAALGGEEIFATAAQPFCKAVCSRRSPSPPRLQCGLPHKVTCLDWMSKEIFASQNDLLT